MTNLSLKHKWIVHNFNSFYNQIVNHKFSECQKSTANCHQFIYSNNLLPKQKDDWGEIFLELCLFGLDLKCEDYISLFINFRPLKYGDLGVKYKVYILDENEQSIIFKEDIGQLGKSARFGWDEFIPHSILNLTNKIKDLIVYCEIEIEKGEISTCRPLSQTHFSESHFFTEKKVLKSLANHWICPDPERINQLEFSQIFLDNILENDLRDRLAKSLQNSESKQESKPDIETEQNSDAVFKQILTGISPNVVSPIKTIIACNSIKSIEPPNLDTIQSENLTPNKPLDSIMSKLKSILCPDSTQANKLVSKHKQESFEKSSIFEFNNIKTTLFHSQNSSNIPKVI